MLNCWQATAAAPPATIVYPTGHVIAYGRDGLGRITTVTVADDSVAPPVVLATDAVYQPFGPLAGLPPVKAKAPVRSPGWSLKKSTVMVPSSTRSPAGSAV